jgi:hypothetical protein
MQFTEEFKNSDIVDSNLFDSNDLNALLWLGRQDLSVIMDVLSLPNYLEKPVITEDITRSMKFDCYY